MEQNYPQAKVTIACGPLASSLFEGFPLLDRIILLKKQPYHRHWIALWRECIATRWDMIVDLRDSAVSRLLWAKKKYIMGSHIDKSQHKVLQNAAVMRLPDAPAPKLWFTDAQMKEARSLIGDGLVIGVGPASNWQGKTWPADRFVQIMHYLTGEGGAFDGARIAVFGAPGEEDICQYVYDALPAEQRVDLIAKGNPALAAAALSCCDFYFGNDSGLMHAAAACGVMTFGVFGPSYPHIYAPWGEHCFYARTPESFDELVSYEGYSPQTAPCLMGSLTVAAVIETLDEFIEAQSRHHKVA